MRRSSINDLALVNMVLGSKAQKEREIRDY